MKANAEAYLGKALENLAAAEADVEAGRHNSAASRAYYAAFQAGVAILIENEVSPRGDAWEHRFVISQVSGKLIRRRKTVPARLTGILDVLLQRRLRADYRPDAVGGRVANDSVNKAEGFVNELNRALKG